MKKGTRTSLAIGVAALTFNVHADDLDAFAKSLDVGTVSDMALSGVFGKTVDQLKDPRSLQIVEAFTIREPNSATGCMEYRSKNGFGGFVGGNAAWNLKIVNSKPVLNFTPNSIPNWNKLCTAKKNTNVTKKANMALEILRNKL